ncbi:MAG: hypothetical protein U0031_11720 [Thermomicrobiales bacterium]
MMVLVGGTASAQDGTPAAAIPLFAPDALVEGLDLAAWSARAWQWSFSLPVSINPYQDSTGAWCGYGQSGPVFFLSGAEESVERSCAIPEGVALFVPLVQSGCSTVEEPPFFGRDEADLRRCAAAAIDAAEGALDMDAMAVTVDGRRFDELAAYRASTPQFALWLPAENELGSDRPVADAAADGYQVMLRPLAAGEHEVVLDVPGPGPGQFATVTYHLSVVSGAYAPPAGTPPASS